MSIALDSNRRIVSSVFTQSGITSYCSVLNTTAIVPVIRRDDAVSVVMDPAPAVELARCNSFSSSSSSSIGKDSDFSHDDGDNEAESSYKEPLGMNSLEEVLPIRRGISNFYNGKSKSFTSLADVSSAAREIAKPENAYSRKRRNLLAYNLIWDKNKASLLKGNNNGISKRSISSSRSSLALAVAMSSRDESNSNLSSFRPTLHPSGRASRSNLASAVPPVCKYPAFRSYPMADLH